MYENGDIVVIESWSTLYEKSDVNHARHVYFEFRTHAIIISRCLYRGGSNSLFCVLTSRGLGYVFEGSLSFRLID